MGLVILTSVDIIQYRAASAFNLCAIPENGDLEPRVACVVCTCASADPSYKQGRDSIPYSAGFAFTAEDHP